MRLLGPWKLPMEFSLIARNPVEIEMLLKDLLRITARESNKLSNILAENFGIVGEELVKILKEEYRKPENDWKVISGCFCVICEASKRRAAIIGNKIFRSTYSLLNQGLLDKRVSVKRWATRAVLNIICGVYMEGKFVLLGGVRGDNIEEIAEVDEEVRELKTCIKSAVFLKSFNSIFPLQLEKRIACEYAGVKEEYLVEMSKSILG